jgi:hypothetical protein
VRESYGSCVGDESVPLLTELRLPQVQRLQLAQPGDDLHRFIGHVPGGAGAGGLDDTPTVLDRHALANGLLDAGGYGAGTQFTPDEVADGVVEATWDQVKRQSRCQEGRAELREIWASELTLLEMPGNTCAS